MLIVWEISHACAKDRSKHDTYYHGIKCMLEAESSDVCNFIWYISGFLFGHKCDIRGTCNKVKKYNEFHVAIHPLGCSIFSAPTPKGWWFFAGGERGLVSSKRLTKFGPFGHFLQVPTKKSTLQRALTKN